MTTVAADEAPRPWRRTDRHSEEKLVASSRKSDPFKITQSLVETVATSPIDLAFALWKLKETDPAGFEQAIVDLGIKRRRAYYLVKVAERFGPAKIPKWLLADVGWTKLAIIAELWPDPRIDGAALDLAQRNTAKELYRILSEGKHPDETLRRFSVYLSPMHHKLLYKALEKHGATISKNGKGLANKEKALMKLVRKALASEKGSAS